MDSGQPAVVFFRGGEEYIYREFYMCFIYVWLLERFEKKNRNPHEVLISNYKEHEVFFSSQPWNE